MVYSLTDRVRLEAGQHAPEVIKVFPPRHKRLSNAAVRRTGALQVEYGLLQHRHRQGSYGMIVQQGNSARSFSRQAAIAFDAQEGQRRSSHLDHLG
jgi:hypothetical protein